MKRSKALFLFCILFSLAYGQDTDEQLANYYYIQGDCEKAVGYFDIVYEKDPSKLVFKRFLECTRKVGDEKDIIKLIKKQIKNHPREYEYQVLLGKEYKDIGDQRKADKIFEEIIDNMNPSSRDIINIQKAFSKYGEYNLALQSLQKGRKIIKGNYPLNIQFAEVYGELDMIEEMIEEYLSLLDYNTSMISSLKRLMPRMIDFEDENSKGYEILKNSLLKRVQKNPNDFIYSEMLIWTFIQRQNFAGALVQAKSLDKRTENDGREVFNIGKIAQSNKDFVTARKAFKYVVELGTSKPYYYAAEKLLLNTRFLEVTVHRNYTKEELNQTIQEYEATLERIGERGSALPIIKELAHILAFYADQPEKAKDILEKALRYQNSTDLARAEIKMLLADVLVVLGDIWESSLLYMQVEKDFKYEPIGFEAKFKNIKIFYYDGDFIWAQSQLDVLKGSTSKLIANDAMKLSIFITDNLGLDSNTRAMEKFAKADLLIEQHKYDEAFTLFDSIKRTFPFHSLADEILLAKAKAMQNQGKWDKAISYLEEIIEKHGDDIHGDDAVFQLANIYENHLFDYEKAKEYYFKILKEYKGSLFVTEARKRYRSLQEEL